MSDQLRAAVLAAMKQHIYPDPSANVVCAAWNTRAPPAQPDLVRAPSREDVASKLAEFFPGKQRVRNLAADAILALCAQEREGT